MKLATIQQNGHTQVGIVEGEQVFLLPPQSFPSIEFIIQGGENLLSEIAAGKDSYPQQSVNEVKIIAPLSKPEKIIGIGLNYRDHCREQNVPIPERPVVFAKFASSIIGTGEVICWSVDITQQVDFEVELGVIIGKTARNVSPQDALNHVFGYTIVNDVTALRRDPNMVDVVRETGVGVCLMHMEGTPQTMQQEAVYEDVVSEVADFLVRRCRELESAGIPSDHLAIDPGLGFAKTPYHNWQIIQGLQKLRGLGYPLVIGHSRKRFIREIVGSDPQAILWGTVGVGLLLAAGGTDILRVHDVKAMRDALALWRRT